LEQFGTFLGWALRAWLALLAALLAWRMLTGGILVSGLLSRKRSGPAGLDRMQLLFITLFFAAAYAVTALAGDYRKALPDVPMPLLLILVGSHTAYLTAKYADVRGGSAGREKS
jgi:hypothetical protein